MIQVKDEWLDKLSKQISSDEEYEIIKYGLRQCFLTLINLMSALTCGAFWNEIPFVLLIFLGLFILRPYAGGYHADTQFRCYIISLGIMSFSIAGKKWINMPVKVWICIYVCTFLIIWKNAPVENAQNPLEDKEMQIYSHKAKLIVVCYSLLEGMGIVLNNDVLCESLFYSVVITAILVLAGKWKYKNFKGEVI